MGVFVVDTSLVLKWFLDDEEDRQYSLTILKSISMAVRRKRIVFEQAEEFLRLLAAMPIDIDPPDRARALQLPPRKPAQSDELRRGLSRIGRSAPIATGNSRQSLDLRREGMQPEATWANAALKCVQPSSPGWRTTAAARLLE
jgi:hypothetical protein